MSYLYQTKSTPANATQRKKASGKVLQDNRAVVQRKPNSDLPTKLQQGMEAMTGIDLSQVKVHRNSSKPAELQAEAYTQGNEIHLASGQEQHLGHELAHVVQQHQGGVAATTTINGMPLNDSPDLEHEADRLGEAALRTSVTPSDSLQSLTDNRKSVQRATKKVVQRKLKKFTNPATGAVAEGQSKAKKAAITIDQGTRTGYSILSGAIKGLYNGKVTNWGKFKQKFAAIGGAGSAHVNNFTNRLSDYSQGITTVAPNKEAGYVIEMYAVEAAKGLTNVTTQYVIGPSRPDFMVDTGEQYDNNGVYYNANGFVDITSLAEASSGHILGKVAKAGGDDDVYNFPHIWDSYYPPLPWNGKPIKATTLVVDAAMKARLKRKHSEFEMAKRRRSTLRSAKN